MKYLPFVLKHLRRNWIRTTSTVLAMAVCIFLFCTLQTVIAAVNWGLRSANASRLVSRNAVSLVYNLYPHYKEKIQRIPGVKRVAGSSWFYGFPGSTPDFKNYFANFAIDAEEYLAMYPELILTAEEKANFLADRRGCVVGVETAKKFGWKVGDTFQLESVIPPYRTGKPFEFVIRGIYQVDDVKYPGTDGRIMFFHYKYLEESTQRRNIGPGTFVVEIDDPRQAGAISKAIDATFENSERETHTETEAAFRAGFISLAGNLTLLLNGIGIAVTFTILLVTANTMSMAVRERRTEIAVLKTLGFGSALVMALILGEAVLLGSLGGGVGILLGSAMIKVLPSVPFVGDAVRQFPNLGLPTAVGVMAFGVSLLLGLLAGVVPAFGAYRSKITDMLRTV
jgi:putative ABC transport system permease protein